MPEIDTSNASSIKNITNKCERNDFSKNIIDSTLILHVKNL